jgi:protocatechuate 4,5-dioxygenase alpha subunit
MTKTNRNKKRTGSYQLSRALYDLRDPDKREAFLADADGYSHQYSMTEEERQLLVRHDWCGLAEAGISIYLLTKLAATLKVDFLEMEGAMRGLSKQEFQQFLDKQAERNRRYAQLLD